ncbi:hypothetical protein HY479_02495 [Candidatus Uhrbacteria bacterium]|nr:hypothetical protein [Candidatus Uhrbacteria bacterium]
MAWKRFIASFLFHLTAASVVLSALLLITEDVIPGSVLPFVDVVDLLPIVLALVIATAVWPRPEP